MDLQQLKGIDKLVEPGVKVSVHNRKGQIVNHHNFDDPEPIDHIEVRDGRLTIIIDR